MSASPKVSIIIPCFDAAETIGLALSSVLAQTTTSWECIVMDDGSTDDTSARVARFDDPRIRYERFEDNRGRGAARQAALERARGTYLAMVDADDWIYPRKLERQLEVLESDTSLCLVGSGVAVVDGRRRLVGVRGLSESSGAVEVRLCPDRLMVPRVIHGPAMIRMPLAKEAGFDASMRFAEDADFLYRLMRGRRYAMLDAVTYAYTEVESITADKVASSLADYAGAFRKYRSRHPIQSRLREAESRLKAVVYGGAFLIGQGDRLVHRRWRSPTAAERDSYDAALGAVLQVQARFGERGD